MRDEGTLQSLGVGTVEERVHEASAGRETEQAPLLVELVLAVEDAMVLVEVVDGAAADNREEEECEHEEDSGEESEQGTQFEADDQEADEKKTDPEESDEETGTDDDEETEDDRPEVDDDSEQDDAEDVAMAHEEEGEAEEEAVMSETEYMLEEEANLQEEEHEPEEAMEEGQGEEGARELQDQQQGSEHPEAGPSPLECPLEALEALRADMEPTNGRGRRSFAPFQLRLGQRRHHRLQQRSAHMQGIRGFWAKAFGNHPQLSAVISEQDLRMLRFMTNLKVQEVTFPSACRRILLFFGKNSYFQNEVLVKEYVVSAAGYRASHSTPIQWSQHYEREAYRRQTHDNGLNFFNWFCGHHLAGSGRIAELIMDDLWPNVLKYYERKKAPGEGSHRRTEKQSQPSRTACANGPGGALNPVLRCPSTARRVGTAKVSLPPLTPCVGETLQRGARRGVESLQRSPQSPLASPPPPKRHTENPGQHADIKEHEFELRGRVRGGNLKGASRCRDEYEATAHLSTAVAHIQMDASGQHGSPAEEITEDNAVVLTRQTHDGAPGAIDLLDVKAPVPAGGAPGRSGRHALGDLLGIVWQMSARKMARDTDGGWRTPTRPPPRRLLGLLDSLAQG
ncbi:LOW QUALITY PROTEIN: uncharacterized protein LOC119868780 [Canis lupus familiaris]|uniref:LOW QUALITY PROTEIN: uncharacterized protein LOC119868780 n=1 Tax=Canis lupus familiaris TaxID=9615 RepID=UPI0018F7BC99|nr:LOW QUALITY PROTEIN: uncharacterized protein LOC119868780 [Canis lupus familiaris]